MLSFHSMKTEDVLKVLQSSMKGLDDSEARARLERYGPNELRSEKQTSPLKIFAEQFGEILIIILLAATFISYLLGEIVDALVILFIVFACAVLGFVQEYRAERSLEALKRMASPTAIVLRNERELQVPSRELVPGDIILIRTGDKVPADARIIEEFNLQVDEAPLTGESAPVKKHSAPVTDAASVMDRANIVFSGTTVTYGHGKAIVFSTGMETEFGKIAQMVQATTEEKTPLENRLEHVGKWLGISCLAVCAIVAGLGIIRGYQILEMLVWGVSLAVAAVPEALPAVVTGALAIGVQRMSRRNAIVRRLPAVETLGCTTVICADKTGTLTKGEMTVCRIYLHDVFIDVTGSGYDPRGEFHASGQVAEDERLSLLSRIGLLCNDAKLEPQNDAWSLIGDPTEGALVVLAAKAGLDQNQTREAYPRINEVPFSSERKRMTTIHSAPDGSVVAYSKGAPEILLEVCTHILRDNGVSQLSEEGKRRILDVNERMASEGLRVLAMAYRNLPATVNPTESAGTYVEQDFTFVGLAGMMDPPRTEAKNAVQTCKNAGVKTIMITGDHMLTASTIARELGILEDGGRVLTGSELDSIGEGELDDLVENVSVYARVSPEHKMRIVTALQARGHIVAMTGDGVNDAPALKKADIGVAMGITGTDVTKEASDMILTDDNFASIVAAMEEGRGIYENIKKYISYLLSCNVGEILVMFIAGILAWPLPLVAVQLLWVNLTTDGLPALALGIDPPDPDSMNRPPRNPRESIFTRPTKALIYGVSLIMAGVLLSTFNWALQAGGLIYAQTMVFTTMVVFEMFNAFNCRSERHSIVKIGFFSNRWLVVAVAVSITMQLAVLYTPTFDVLFDTVPLSLTDWLTIFPLASTPLIITELAKIWRGLLKAAS
ncbi:MAG: calcium-transporting P-type ATPase, PMR1-type [Candidatus Bathyarchaeia archaeon]